MSKHRLKHLLRDLYAAVLYYSGAYLLLNRVSQPRLLILAGHCVSAPCNAQLPADMKISPARLERVLRALARFGHCCTLAEGLDALAAGVRGAHVTLTMDDGYKDNASVLPDLLERSGARATIFLESRALLERRLNWSHKWFWLISRFDLEEVTRQYMARARDVASLERLRLVLEAGRELAYEVKRVFKYEAPAEERDCVLDEIFRARGGDEAALCEALYMNLDEALATQARGLELGGHTVNHHVLSTLPASEAEREIREGREALRVALGESTGRTFAYPFGRRWDFDEAAAEAVARAGYEAAVTTHSGCNAARSDRLRLARWMIDEQTPISHLVAEACGGFALLRRLGIEFVQ